MSRKILVADDSPTVRKLAESLLGKQGYEVLCAEDGSSALGLAETEKPDLIFWDASLPVLDGRGVCQELKGNDELRDTPVVILLAGDQADEVEELKRVGADAFAVKPFNPRQILEKVHQFLHPETADLPEEMPAVPKEQPAGAEEASGTDKPQEGLAPPEEKEKTDESLDIIETSDFLESFKASLSGSEAAEDHGFDWFVSELRKELDETEQADLDVAPEAKKEVSSKEIISLPEEDSGKKDEDEKKEEAHQTDEERQGFDEFLSELKRGSEETVIQETQDRKPPRTDYDEIARDLIERVSTRIAQEVVKKIDPDLLTKMLQDEIGKLRREGMEAD